MSSVREQMVKEWADDDTEWVRSDEPVTLHEPHQRIDYKPGMAEYKRGERGCWCGHCGAKVTLGNNSEEYGHFGECPHRNIDRKPSNNSGMR